MAPEVAKQKGHNHLADFYNIGTLAFELVSGMPPYDYYRKFTTEMRVNTPYPLIPKAFSPEFKDLCSKLLIADPTKRLGSKGGVAEIRQHPWFKDVDFTLLETRKGKPYLDVGISGVNLAILDSKIAKNPFDSALTTSQRKNFNAAYFEIADFNYNYEESNVMVLSGVSKSKNQWDDCPDTSSDNCCYTEYMEEKNSYDPSVYATERFFNSFCSTEDMNRTVQPS